MLKQSHTRAALVYTVLMMVFITASLVSATYAWFTTNETVSTSRVETQTATEGLTLLVDNEGGDQFKGSEVVEPLQVNAADMEKLMPVSTGDLTHFVYSPATVEDQAVVFLPVENEEFYYHGRVYLKAEGEGFGENARLALYLNDRPGKDPIFMKGEDSLILNAARLGLRFDDGTRHILSLSPYGNPGGSTVSNTVLNGVPLGAGMVIQSDGAGNLTPAADPAEDMERFLVSELPTGVEGVYENHFPEAPLLLMELNRVYTLDIYFYLEGCDPSCTNEISYHDVDMSLFFLGQLVD